MSRQAIKTIVPLILTVFIVLFVGCSTGKSVVKLGEAPGGYTTLTHERITLRLSYINERDLYKLYSQKNNPFMKYKTGRLIVIETALQSDLPLRLKLREALLSTPGGDRGPTPKEDVYYYWYSRLIFNYGGYSRYHSPHESTTISHTDPGGSMYLSSYGYGGRSKAAFHDWSLKVTTQIIDETIFPHVVDVQAGSETVGYILFDQIRGEKKVEADFTLPVYDQHGELLHEFELQFPI
jgi:hypothetical protein